jgi:hypothetical protein
MSARVRELIFLTGATADRDWAEWLSEPLEAAGLDTWIASRDIASGTRWDASVDSAIETSSAALVLVSPDVLDPGSVVGSELVRLVDRARQRDLPLTWVLLRQAEWRASPLVEFQAAYDPERPLDSLSGSERQKAFVEIAQRVADLVSGVEGATRSRDANKGSGDQPESVGTRGIDLDELASRRFEPDASVVNGSSIAFLLETSGRSVLVSGDARAGVLADSIRSLLSVRGIERLPLDAFVVPHHGSRRNVSDELLNLIACDRYLISTNGKIFGHPDHEAIARIITRGRSGPDARPVLVFNYRTEHNQMWSDPALQERYGYEAVYPDGDAAGIRVDLA